MGVGEKTPLRGGEDHVPYVFMSDPNRAYKKKVRLLQCYLCSAIIGVLALALLVSVVYSVDNDIIDETPANGSLSLKMMSPDSGNAPQVNEQPEEPSSVMERNMAPGSQPKKIIVDPTVPIDWKAEFNPCSDYSLIKPTCLSPWQRSADGFCNNQNHPLTWGVSGRPFKRLLPSDYCDDLSAPRCAASKLPLPPALSVGSKLQELMAGKLTDNNMILMLWGNYVYQDLVGEFESKAGIDCCSPMGKADPSCFPIEIPMDSPYYHLYNTTCLSFSRSKAVTCTDGKRAQLNKATSYLDGSAIYGSTKKVEGKIRSYLNGQITMFMSPENKFLPVFIPEAKECNVTKQGGPKKCPDEAISCISGRMNLPSMNLLFAKQHNFIASQLGLINPLWDDETIYQATKKIVSAQIQHITYNEFLETVVGSENMKSFGDNSETGYYQEYDINTDATVSAAFPAVFRLVNAFLPENTNFPDETMESAACNLNRLGEQIQRSRDHGLPGYTKWREYCGLGATAGFPGLTMDLGAEAVTALQGLYPSVEDIDLVAGLMAEMHASGKILGPVGTCIVTEQFKRTKTGDRFWYETSHQPESFSPGQLAEIHKTTLSRIICDNSKSLKMIQYNSMMATDNNPTLSCYTLPALNLSLWQELPASPNMLQDSMPDTFNPNYNPAGVPAFMKSGNEYMLQSAKGASKSDITKKATSFTVNIINATITKGSELIFESYGGKPPFTIPLDSFVDTSGYNPSATVEFTASYEDDILTGTASLSAKDNDFFQKGPKAKFNVNFTAGVAIKWGGSFTHDPKKTYSCKLMFQSYAKLSSSMVSDVHAPLGADEAGGETCTLLAIGTYYKRPFYCPLTPWWCKEGLIFYWSGETKLIFVKPNPVIENKLTKPSLKLSQMPAQKSQKALGKTGDAVVEKTFASVTVVQGKVTGQFNGEEPMDVMAGGPPVDIYLDNFIDPRGFDASSTVTFTATPVEDNSVVGTFSVPYYPSVDNYSERRKFTANFSVALIYKYGGSISIIDPQKTYTCKVMFQANKKSTLNSNSLQLTNALGKTPFGESCSITLSGSFYQPSILCFWCTKAQIFTWSGDIELALKYKYNATDNELSTKKLSQKLTAAGDVAPAPNSYQDGYSVGHRYGGRVISGWIQAKTGGFFSAKKTVWSGDIPFEIELPLFWNATSPDDAELSDTFGHSILWSGSIFHSAIQGTFQFPQTIGRGPGAQVNWINGKFSFEFAANPYVSLYDLVVPGLQYQSNLYMHNSKMPDDRIPFSYPKVRGPTQDEVSGVRAPIILLGRRTDSKHFVWNGTFIIDFSRTAKDLYYG